jgi:hypothetical protein
MGIEGPVYVVTCDECSVTIYARTSPGVVSIAKHYGWTFDGDRALCPDCSEEKEK